MTTRSRARVYRRDPRPLPDEACPQCFRLIAIHPTSYRRRLHRDQEGRDCTGSGVIVGTPPLPDVDLLNVEITIADREGSRLPATGLCHECEKPISRDRRFCGACFTKRGTA